MILQPEKIDAPNERQKALSKENNEQLLLTTPSDFLFKYLRTFGTLTYKECYAIIELYLYLHYDYTFSPNKISRILQKTIIVNCKNKMRAIYDDESFLIGMDAILDDGHGNYYRGMTPYNALQSDAIWPYLALARKGVKLVSVIDSEHNDIVQAVIRFPNEKEFSVCRLNPENRDQTHKKLDAFLNRDEEDRLKYPPLFFALGKTLNGLEKTVEYLLWDEYLEKYQSMPCIVMNINYNAQVGFQFISKQSDIFDPYTSAFWYLNPPAKRSQESVKA